METHNGILAGDARVCYRTGQGSHVPGTASRSESSESKPGAASLIPESRNKVVDMSELTIGEMIKQVPEGQRQVFEPSISEPGEERYFQVWQNWEYRPERLEWLNGRSGPDAPWLGTRASARTPVSTLPPPDVRFKGPAKQVVDFYSTGSHAFFISDRLFRLIEAMDSGSLEHIEFELRAKDAALPFHAVMPLRTLEAVDPRRTTVVIEDKPLGDRFWRNVKFPEGIIFDADVLQGVSSFSDIDVPGWYWSKDLIEEVKGQGARGIYSRSVASAEGHLVHTF
jgi:hypothetical protein